MSTLQRRRKAGGGGAVGNIGQQQQQQGGNSDDDGDDQIVNTPTPSSKSMNGATSYFDQENGHRVAYDPRDMAQNEDHAKQPRLTLMEEVLLMGLKDRQGYLSFWNDSISYALRGCIIMELAFRSRLSMVRDPNRRRFPLADRLIEVIDDSITGEVLLDETLKMMKASPEKMSVGTWIDLLSGETWNLLKIGYQLKQVRERLAKGLVDKGILTTEKRNFLLFDMNTHPVCDMQAKDEIKRRTIQILTARTVILHPTPLVPPGVQFRYLRTVCLICAAYAANVLENVLSSLGPDMSDFAFNKADELLSLYSQWPYTYNGQAITDATATVDSDNNNNNHSNNNIAENVIDNNNNNNSLRPALSSSAGIGGNTNSFTLEPTATDALPQTAVNLPGEIAREISNHRDMDLQIEVVAAVLNVFTRLDTLL